MHLTACLQSRGETPIVETVMIVNISSHGARVLARRHWQPHEQLVLTEVVGGYLHVDAEVVYWQRLDLDQCAVGLKFAKAIDTQMAVDGRRIVIRQRPDE